MSRGSSPKRPRLPAQAAEDSTPGQIAEIGSASNKRLALWGIIVLSVILLLGLLGLYFLGRDVPSEMINLEIALASYVAGALSK